MKNKGKPLNYKWFTSIAYNIDGRQFFCFVFFYFCKVPQLSGNAFDNMTIIL